jgi:hypothetical protein
MYIHSADKWMFIFMYHREHLIDLRTHAASKGLVDNKSGKNPRFNVEFRTSISSENVYMNLHIYMYIRICVYKFKYMYLLRCILIY